MLFFFIPEIGQERIAVVLVMSPIIIRVSNVPKVRARGHNEVGLSMVDLLEE